MQATYKSQIEETNSEQKPDIKSILYDPKTFAHGVNLAGYLEDALLAEIGENVCKEYKIDYDSCEEWRERTEPAIELAMLIWKQKNTPFTNAANVKYPILTTAAIQFSARAYPNIVKGRNVVKGKVVGKDVLIPPPDPRTGQPPMIMDPKTGQPMPAPPIPGAKSDIARRVSEHMSYQVLEQMEEWEEDLDKGLVTLPIVGEMWKKTYFDPTLKRNKSCLVMSDNIAINYWAKSVNTATRITEKIWYYPNEIEEKKRSGYYSDVELFLQTSSSDEKTLKMADSEDPDKPALFLEQHRYLDLDEDGYKEPYIVTVHESSRKVVRVYPRYDLKEVEAKGDKIIRIKPVHYYTQTLFFPSPDGGSRGMGLGNLIRPINETVNTTINQLLDAGSRQNNPSGWIGKGAMMNRGRGGGYLGFELGEWRSVPIPGDDLRKAIVSHPTPDPSSVLFQLLGMMITAGKEVASVSEVLTGETSGANMPVGTIMSLIEQGLKVFGSVYKRIHRGLKSEFKKLYRLNSIYLSDEEYFRVMDDEKAITRIDYNIEGIDVIPVSDPADVSDAAKMIKAQFLQSMQGRGLNDQEINKRILEAANIEEPEKIMNAPPPPEDPKLMIEKEKLRLEWARLEWEITRGKFEIMKIEAMATKAFAEAGMADAQPRVEILKQELKNLNAEADRINERWLAKNTPKQVEAK